MGYRSYFQMFLCKQMGMTVAYLYAAANAIALAYGRDPTTQVYIPRMMRSHLYKCFENKHIEPFPVANTKAKRKKQKKVFDVPIHLLRYMWPGIPSSV